jgi:hypothetical protein
MEFEDGVCYGVLRSKTELLLGADVVCFEDSFEAGVQNFFKDFSGDHYGGGGFPGFRKVRGVKAVVE